MPGAGYPDLLRPVVDLHKLGRRDEAVAAYERVLPLVNYENRQAGLLASKILMKEGEVIASDHAREPLAKLHPGIRAGLIETRRAAWIRWCCGGPRSQRIQIMRDFCGNQPCSVLHRSA